LYCFPLESRKQAIQYGESGTLRSDGIENPIIEYYNKVTTFLLIVKNPIVLNEHITKKKRG
jgi:hypothetical protein